MAKPGGVSPGKYDQNAAPLPLVGPAKSAKLVNSRLPSEGWIFLQQSKKNGVPSASIARRAPWQDQFKSVQAKSSRLATPAVVEYFLKDQ